MEATPLLRGSEMRDSEAERDNAADIERERDWRGERALKAKKESKGPRS